MHPEIFKNRWRENNELNAQLLRWSRNDEFGDLKRLGGVRSANPTSYSEPTLQNPIIYPTFDIVLASDCLFFKDFHLDLYWLLKHSTSPGSMIFLLQPQRGGTLDMFLDIVKRESDFDWELSNDYLRQV